MKQKSRKVIVLQVKPTSVAQFNVYLPSTLGTINMNIDNVRRFRAVQAVPGPEAPVGTEMRTYQVPASS